MNVPGGGVVVGSNAKTLELENTDVLADME